MSSHYTKRDKCAVCENTDLQVILDYGKVPPAGGFPKEEDFFKEELYPLNVLFCPLCKLVQIDSILDSDFLFKDYRYLSSPGLWKHFTNVAEMLIQDFKLDTNSWVLDIGCNDGVLLKPLQERGINAVGIDPSVNVSQIARDNGCNVITGYFNENSYKEHFANQKFDVVTCSNCFAHINDINAIVKGVKNVLKPNGIFVIEVHYLKNLISHLQYDNIYHEHLFMWSLRALCQLFFEHDMSVVKAEEIPVHAGSIRVYVTNYNHQSEHTSFYVNNGYFDSKDVQTVNSLLSTEWEYSEFDGLKQFQKDVYEHRDKVKALVRSLVDDGNTIIGYGASGRANMMAHICDFTPDMIQYIVDESPERAGRFLSRTHIPIISKEDFELKKDNVDYVFIFAWNFAKMIMDKLEGKNYKFIIPFPEPRIVENADSLDLALTL